MYFSCKCNVWKILALVIILKFEMKESLHLCVYVTFSRARAYTLYCATTVLTICFLNRLLERSRILLDRLHIAVHRLKETRVFQVKPIKFYEQVKRTNLIFVC